MWTQTESMSHLTRALLLTLLMTLTCCSTPDDSDVNEQERTQTEYPQGIEQQVSSSSTPRTAPGASSSQSSGARAAVTEDTKGKLSLIRNHGIARLLFKHMRFRDLPEISEVQDEQQSDMSEFGPWLADNSRKRNYLRQTRNPSANNYFKREQQELLVNNLAALLAESSRGKNSASTLRMPSLRFG